MLNNSDLEKLRQEYKGESLDEKDCKSDPLLQFSLWFKEAEQSIKEEVNAMILSTATPKGIPSSRTVLLKGVDERGFIFYSNYKSRKGEEMLENPHVSLLFFWKELARQVRIEGLVQKVSRSETQSYFQQRPLGSQLGAWASPQSKVIQDRAFLENNFKNWEEKFAAQSIVEAPDYWGGYVVAPYKIEFWQGRESRLHDRILYTLTQIEPKSWKIERLAP